MVNVSINSGLEQMVYEHTLVDEAATLDLGQQLAASLDRCGLVIYLHGDLGAGKTTLARALLRGLGVHERIKSPTYSLVECYPFQNRLAWHMDLYRIADPGELEWLGLDDLSDPNAVVLVEWPEHGHGALPLPDLNVTISYAGVMRRVRLEALTQRARQVMSDINET